MLPTSSSAPLLKATSMVLFIMFIPVTSAGSRSSFLIFFCVHFKWMRLWATGRRPRNSFHISSWMANSFLLSLTKERPTKDINIYVNWSICLTAQYWITTVLHSTMDALFRPLSSTTKQLLDWVFFCKQDQQVPKETQQAHVATGHWLKSTWPGKGELQENPVDILRPTCLGEWGWWIMVAQPSQYHADEQFLPGKLKH